ncbi:actin filament-associated protein 1-like 2 isoform X2 [Lampris incognitus]|uniref:actin filament-associated protein 1-like 2 isoform X2 n=1 Tax=Lampris incognitus TaxID=2546036 RepID=UPI0024B55287|nr:actin filament-associated protein 1-like 2 isoform X2 [Lampris incognitus]
MPSRWKSLVGREPFPLPSIPAPTCMDSVEGYYEEAQPYEETANDDGEAVSSSYESYDEEEVTRGKSAQHQWPSAEASIELMKDARICAFLWRKKWLGQWAKQLCVVKDQRLLFYKSSKEQTPLLDVSLVGCSVVYKEKQLRKKEHKLKIIPVGGETIVLGLQSKEQTEQWLKVIQEISPRPAESCDPQHFDSPRLICTKGDLSERHSVASESGSSTDSHAETPDTKDVKKKYGASLKLSNLMNIGKKKPSSMESPEKCVDTSGYLNVLVNSQWRTRWCLIKNGQLWFYQDKGKTKVSQPALPLEGCSVVPDPSPEHLYSFRIDLDGTQIATLEAKSSADMGHWLGLLLSQTGAKTDPEELTYDYVNSERISSIVNAAKTSLYLMQRRYSEPNTYIDSLPSVPHPSDELYDDVASIGAEPEDAEEAGLLDDEDNSVQEDNELCTQDAKEDLGTKQDAEKRIYLDLTPVRSFLHTSCNSKGPSQKESSEQSQAPTNEQQAPPKRELDLSNQMEPDSSHTTNSTSKPEQECPLDPSPPRPQLHQLKTSSESQEPLNKSGSGPQIQKAPTNPAGMAQSSSSLPAHGSQNLRARSTGSGDRPKAYTIGCPGAVEGKLGKNRTEADMRRYTDERDRLEKEREEVRSCLANLKKERRETKEGLSACQDPRLQASLEASLKQNEEASREAERQRVEVELQLVEVKESLRKVEAGPFTLGTTLDSSLQETPMVKAASVASPQTPASQSSSSSSGYPSSPVNSATALKNRPASIMATSKGNVLQKAKEWEKKSTN